MLITYDRATPPTSPQRAQQAAHYAEHEQCQMGSPPGCCQPQPNPQSIPNTLVVCHGHIQYNMCYIMYDGID